MFWCNIKQLVIFPIRRLRCFRNQCDGWYRLDNILPSFSCKRQSAPIQFQRIFLLDPGDREPFRSFLAGDFFGAQPGAAEETFDLQDTNGGDKIFGGLLHRVLGNVIERPGGETQFVRIVCHVACLQTFLPRQLFEPEKSIRGCGETAWNFCLPGHSSSSKSTCNKLLNTSSVKRSSGCRSYSRCSNSNNRIMDLPQFCNNL